MFPKSKAYKPASTRRTKPSFLDDLAFSFATPGERKRIAEKHRAATREARDKRKHGERKHRDGGHDKKKTHRAETDVRYSHEERAGEGPPMRGWEGGKKGEKREYKAGAVQWNSKGHDGHVSLGNNNEDAYVISVTGEETSEKSKNLFFRWMDDKLSHLEVDKGEAEMVRDWKVVETSCDEWSKERERGEDAVEISVAGPQYLTSEGGSRRSKDTESTQTGNSLSSSWPTRGYTPGKSGSRGHSRGRTREDISGRSSGSPPSSRSTKSRYGEKRSMDSQVAHPILDTEPHLSHRDPDAIAPKRPKAGSAPSEWFLGGEAALTEENLQMHTASGAGQRGYQAKSLGWAAERVREGERGEGASDGGSEVSLWEEGGDDGLEPEDSISVAWMKVGYWGRRPW